MIYKLFRDWLRTILSPKVFYALRDQIKKDNEILYIYNLLKSQKEHSVMIDVGAHFGGSLIRFAFMGWEIFAFEPDNKNRKELEELCMQYSFSNVNIDKRAVSDKEQNNLTYYTSDISTGISGLSKFHETHIEQQEVSTTTLTKFIDENFINKVDFLKIDTEGWDYFVLKGFPFDKIKPRVIMAEFEDRKTVPLGYDWNQMAQYLESNGYRVLVSEWYPVKEYGGNHKWRGVYKYPNSLKDVNAGGNLLAFMDNDDLNNVFSQIKKITN